MEAKCQRSSRCWIGLLGGLLVGGSVFAQGGSIASQPSGAPDLLTQYETEQWTLDQESQTLLSEGASEQQLEAWQQENAPEFAAQLQLAQTLAVASALQPLPIIDAVTVPDGASDTLADFLVTQANLENASAQIYNQLLQAMPADANQGDIDGMVAQEESTFEQQYASDLNLQLGRAQALAAESASEPMPIPDPVTIPPGASAQLTAYLIAHNALMSAQIQLWNQNLTADPDVRNAAMQQWTQENASWIQQVAQMAQAIADSTLNQQGN